MLHGSETDSTEKGRKQHEGNQEGQWEVTGVASAILGWPLVSIKVYTLTLRVTLPACVQVHG
jgi:hypothetical protein